MATAVQKIASLSTTRDIPFNKLLLSQSNVRRVKAGVSIDTLAEDIARRGLLQNLNVRPVVDGEGQETGRFEVPAGGRRFRALEVLVRSKRLAKTAPVPCNVREAGSPITAEEDSLAENTQREALHPLDQFRSFKRQVDAGASEDEVAARFFVPVAVVRQRLRLASVADALLEVYAEDGMTLDQLMAFTVTGDHARQLQVWEALQKGYGREPYTIRRMLTEGAVAATDRRAVFVGVEAYQAAGGAVGRDLFAGDRGGWFENVPLLQRLATERLAREAEAIGAEGWKWVEAALDFPYGHTVGRRRIHGERPEVSDEEQAAHEALTDELERLCAAHEGGEDLPEEVDARLSELETAIEAFNHPPLAYDPAEVARAGAFVSIGADGSLRVERGFVRLEDEGPVAADPVGGDAGSEGGGKVDIGKAEPQGTVITIGGASAASEELEEDGTLRPLSERLVTELTAHRTLALRDALAIDPDTAHLAVLHALCLPAFYRFGGDTCLELTAKSAGFASQPPGLAESASAKAIEARHEFWARRLPQAPDDLWPTLASFGPGERHSFFAHVASLTVNVTKEPFNRRPGAIAHGEALARAVGLDLAGAGWTPTVDAYLGRVPKARILEAVREAKGEMAAQLIDHLKKPEMAKEAERLLAGTGWLPEPLRVEGVEAGAASEAGEAEALPDFLAEDEGAEADEPEPVEGAFAVAAE